MLADGENLAEELQERHTKAASYNRRYEKPSQLLIR